jgi:FkbM family methyltransferase
MIFTTKAKLFLKKYSPSWLFPIIRFTADNTILKLIPLAFKVRTLFFTKQMVKSVNYHGKHFKLVIDPKNGYLDSQIYTLKLYEPHIVAQFVKNIHAGDVCLDVGANIGHHTIIMAQSAGDSGHVYAYEPIPYIREQMEKSLALNNITNVTTVPNALSYEEGTLNLYLNEGNIAGSSFVNEARGNTIPVCVKTLDSYNYKKVDFIKIDVEGFEYNVLKGGEQTIAAFHPKILFEFSPVYYRKNTPSDIIDILLFFKKHNYTLIDLEDSRKTVSNIDTFLHEFDTGLRSQTNILAIP